MPVAERGLLSFAAGVLDASVVVAGALSFAGSAITGVDDAPDTGVVVLVVSALLPPCADEPPGAPAVSPDAAVGAPAAASCSVCEPRTDPVSSDFNCVPVMQTEPWRTTRRCFASTAAWN